jgi:Ca2+-binding RTX toxin-like protein
MSGAGTINLGGVSKFANIYLANGNNAVTVTDATLSGVSTALHDGLSGNNTISAAGDTAASGGKTLYYYAGTGIDSFTGGFENDTIYAGTGLGTFTAGSGNDKFVFIADNLPTQTLDNFQVSADDLVVYGTHAGQWVRPRQHEQYDEPAGADGNRSDDLYRECERRFHQQQSTLRLRYHQW